MGIGGGKGHRIGAGKLGIGHIAEGAVRAQADRAVARRGLGAGGQTRAVGHVDGARNHMLRRARTAGGRIGQRIADHHLRRGLADVAFGIGGGEGDGIRTHKPLRCRVAVSAIGVHMHAAIASGAAGRMIKPCRIGRAVGARIAGRQRPLSISGRRADRIGHHNLGGGRSDHAMGIGGGKGHRIGAGKLGVGNITIGAVRAQANGAMSSGSLRTGSQAGAVGDVQRPCDHLLSRAAAARGTFAQAVADHHMGGHHRSAARAVIGRKDDGIGAHETSIRRIGIGAAGSERDRAMLRRSRLMNGKPQIIGNRIGTSEPLPQRPLGIAGTRGQGIRNHNSGSRRDGKGGGRTGGRTDYVCRRAGGCGGGGRRFSGRGGFSSGAGGTGGGFRRCTCACPPIGRHLRCGCHMHTTGSGPAMGGGGGMLPALLPTPGTNAVEPTHIQAAGSIGQTASGIAGVIMAAVGLSSGIFSGLLGGIHGGHILGCVLRPRHLGLLLRNSVVRFRFLDVGQITQAATTAFGRANHVQTGTFKGLITDV